MRATERQSRPPGAGALVMERFELRERLGSGGMGIVYRAFDRRLQREVAVKEIEADPDRVLREAQAAARLNHPGIVTLYELGEHRGRVVLVSELVPGRTLSELRTRGELSDRAVAEIGLDVCEALVHAHARGVVHRDVKPHNVVVCERAAGGKAKLMDFGVARMAGGPTLTGGGEVVGTLAYMSPEQASGLAAGPASDVYSLAISLYECWTGEHPVAARTPAETARRIGRPIPSLAELRPDLPATLTAAIDACLDPDPELRPSPTELRQLLLSSSPRLDEGAVRRISLARETSPRNRLASRPGLLAAAGFAALLVLLAGPLGAGGVALVLAALTVPALAVSPSIVALAGPAGTVSALAGIAGAAPAAAALASRPLARLTLGAVAWAWMLAAALAFGLVPRLGIAPQAPAGWAGDPALAAETVLLPILAPESLLAATTFALAALALGWALSRRHLAPALLGAVLWAAGFDAALLAVTEGLGGRPIGLALAAAAAVAIEFGVVRAERPAEQPAGGGCQPRGVGEPATGDLA